ncbi:MAG TPA: hypothetical protein VNA69_19385, partial [Thermoanaerobaculia bacterium]|nr:hypothetical protein [Thermoanaerobaculia bacterium]
FRSLFGRGWWSLFDARLIVLAASGGDTIAMTTETNETAGFLRRNGVYSQLWPTGQQVPDTLTFDGAYYVLRRAGSTFASLYRASDGRFAGLRQLGSGREMRIEWSAEGMPVSVTDSWTGLTWTLTTDAAKRRITEIAIGDLVWRYEYDANDNLQRVLAPESATWRAYTYVNDRMTEARDASGNLIESHNYNSVGAAIDSTGPDDEIENIQYLAGTAPNEKIARLTMKTGAIAEYVLQPIGNAYRTVRITGGCSSCGARDASYAYDAEGHLVREQDASGYITVHTYAEGRQTAVEEHLRPQGCDPATDPNRCRLDPASLATAALEATTATIRTDYEYADPIWPDKPTSVATTSVLVPGGSRVTATVYHPLSGQVLRTNVSGWTGDAAKTDRGSSTIFYGDPPPNDDSDSALFDPYAPAFDPGGTFQSAWLALSQPPLLPKLMDGPRIDAEDLTLFVYYPVSEAIPSEMRGRLAAVKNAAGHVTHYESYDLFGNVTRVVDPNGVATEMEYDILGRLETTTIKGVAGCDTAKDPLCATDLTSTRIYSPPAGPLDSETRPGGGVTKYTYDTRGRIQTVSRGPSATDLRERIEYTYDAATSNKSGEVISALEGGTWVEKTRESFSYDTLGQLKRVTHAPIVTDGIVTEAAFAEYEYDAEGRVSGVRDEKHTTANTCYEYDPAGRVAKVAQTLGTTPCGGITTRYGYDAHGNLTSVTDPNGNVTTYVYDDFGSLISQQSPVTGTTFYHYDDAGNLIDTADARGARTTRAYDALGRVVTAETTLDGVTETVSWTYDDTTTGTFGIGRLAKMTDPAGTTDYRYERRGLLREEQRAFMASAPAPPPDDDGRSSALTGACGPGDPEPLAGKLSGDGRIPAPGPLHQATTKFTYDRDGNRASIAYPSTQLMVNYTFDFAGRPLNASGVINSAKYLPFGPLTELKFANSTTQTMQYDARYRMTRNDLTIDGVNGNQGEIARYLIGYDPASNITSINDGKDSEYNRQFEYDDLHRLTKANTGAALWRKGDYQWDAMGNIVRAQLTEVIPGGPENLSAGNPKKFKPTDRPRSKKDLLRAGIQPLGRIMSFSYDETTPVITAVTLNDLCRPVRHDEAGNETAYAVTRSYWPRNLLASVSDSFNSEDPVPHTVAYSYDGRGVRATRTEFPSNGPDTLARRYYIYTPELQLLSATRDDAENVWEPDAFPQPSFANNVHYEIIWFGGRPVAQFNPGSFTRFTFTDHLGTPILQTD